MKKQNVRILKLKKSKISSFDKLSKVVGGTNDTTKSVGTPSLELTCDYIITSAAC